MREGDAVIVNVAALDLDLGSGGYDLIHANLSRGMQGGPSTEEHVMKLNYTSLQHPVVPIERPLRDSLGGDSIPVLVLPLHGHLAPAAWAARQVAPGLRLGYVQTAGGALPGSLSRDVARLRGEGLLSGHITAAPAYGGEHEALSVIGAIDAGAHRLGWDAVLAGPGPGIIGSGTHLGHGGLAALDTAHAALSLQMPTLLSPRLSAGDLRERHRGLSHHTRTVLELLLAPLSVAAPRGEEELIASLRSACAERHDLRIGVGDLGGYRASGLPAQTMGRGIDEDPAFFAAALAAGSLLAS
jgi:hypothetical protein